MTRIRRFPSCLTLLVLMAPVSSAWADGPRFEITPFGGYRMGGEFDTQGSSTEPSRTVDLENGASWGLDVGIYRDSTSFYEILYSSQTSNFESSDPDIDRVDVTTDYIHFGGTLLFEDQYWVVPYFSFTIGATLFDASGGYDSDTKFSISAGTGLRMPFNEHFAATLGLRGFLTFVNSDTDLFCVSQPQQGESGCLVKSSGSTYFQGEATAGLTLRF